MDFRKIEFGKADAKEEGNELPNLLINGYLNTHDIINIVINKSIFLFLGYKGSGKTALSEHLRLTQNNFNCFVNPILLSDFPYKNFSKIVSGTELEAKLPIAWEWLLLIYAINSLSEDQGATTLLPTDLEDTLKALRQSGILPIVNIRDFVTKSAKTTFKVHIASLFEFAFSRENPTSESDIKFLHIVNFLKRVLEHFASGNKHLIIIDGLDEILTSREIQYQSIAALINQAKELNFYFRTKNIPVKIVVLCRTDIFERLPHPNKNKIRQDSAFIFNWFDESETEDYTRSNLIRIAQLRGNLIYPNIQDIFKTFFPEKYEGQNIYAALLNFTRHTPRDFLQLLNNIQKYCKNTTVQTRDIDNGIKNYSLNYFLPEIKDELVGYIEFDKIDLLFNMLSALRKRDFSFREIQSLSNTYPLDQQIDLHNIFKVLFECSAIGHIVNNRLYFKYRNRNMSFNERDTIILHKGLWKALII